MRPLRKRGEFVVIGANLGETRTAIGAAFELEEAGFSCAVMSQVAKIPGVLSGGDSPFPVGHGPFNAPWSAILMLIRWRPKAILFVEFSSNYHLAFWARILGIKTIVINVNLPESRMIKLAEKPLGRWQFSFVDAFLVQHSNHGRRLQLLGVEPSRIAVTGVSLSPVALIELMGESAIAKWQKLLSIRTEQPVILAASTYPQEERLILKAMNHVWAEFPDCVLVLAPRHLDRAGGAASALELEGIDFDRRSSLDRFPRSTQVVLLDSLGELREVYSVASVAHIGGTLGEHVGGHTPLEALAWGVPATMGPHFGQQEGPVELCQNAGVLEVLNHPDAVCATWLQVLRNPKIHQMVKRRATTVLEEYQPTLVATIQRVMG